MYRNMVNQSGGQSFMDKFRNGFRTIMSEVNKLEQITADLDNLSSSTTYFNDSIVTLDKTGELYDETLELYTVVTEHPINIDLIEERLLALREKLIKFEERPELLKLGYEPYIPSDTLIRTLAGNGHEDGVVAELSFSSETNGTTERMQANKMFTPSKFAQPIEHQMCTPKESGHMPMPTSSVKSASKVVTGNGTGDSQPTECDGTVAGSRTATVVSSLDKPKRAQPPVVNNPKLANCLSILQKWNTMGSGDTSIGTAASKPTAPSTLLPPSAATSSNTKPTAPISPMMSSNRHLANVKPNLTSINRSKTFTMETKPRQFDPSEYETVEFTPGMTSKVIRK